MEEVNDLFVYLYNKQMRFDLSFRKDRIEIGWVDKNGIHQYKELYKYDNVDDIKKWIIKNIR